MIRANIHEARADFSDCLRRVRDGERVVVCDRNVPAAEIVPFRSEQENGHNRMINCQALVEAMVVVTPDRAMVNYPITTRW